MQQTTSKTVLDEKKPQQFQNENEAEILDLDEHREIVEARKKIAALINNKEWRKFVSQETLKGYQDYLEAQIGPVTKETGLKSDSTPHVDDLQGLLGLYKYMSKEWEAAQQRLQRIENLIQGAIVEKIASPLDMEFLISHLILTGEYDLSEENAQKFENVVRKKTYHMRQDMIKFRKFSKHKFVENINLKKIEAKEKINLKDKSSFLNSTVPERRNFLKLVEDALIKEEIQAAYNETNERKMKSLYVTRLKGKLSKRPGKGCIGKHTYETFAKELEKLDLEGLKVWHDGFVEEMAPREDFWQEVRSTLKNEGLKKMEGMIHKMGLKALKVEFERVKKDESERLCNKYDLALEAYQGDVAGKHTIGEFKVWIRKAPLAVQYGAESHLGDWEGMGKYMALWNEISELTEEDREYMESKIDVWGYSEFKKELTELKKRQGIEKETNESEMALSKVKNSGIKSGIEEMAENLEVRSLKEQDNVIHILEIQAQLKTEPSRLQKLRKDTEEESEAKITTREERMNAEFSKTKEREGKKAEVVELEEFKKIKTDDGEEVKHVMANQESGMSHLLANYSQTDNEAKNTKISFSKEGQDVQDLGNNAHHAVLYLKAKRKEQMEAKEAKIAKAA